MVMALSLAEAERALGAAVARARELGVRVGI